MNVNNNTEKNVNNLQKKCNNPTQKNVTIVHKIKSYVYCINIG